MHKIILQETARKNGDTHFFTGTPCVKGHLSERLVSNGKCVTCYAEWYQNNKARRKEKQKEHYENNKDSYIKNARNWEKQNPDRAREINREWMKEQRAKLKQEQKG